MCATTATCASAAAAASGTRSSSTTTGTSTSTRSRPAATLLFALVMSLAAASMYSSIVQLQRSYYSYFTQASTSTGTTDDDSSTAGGGRDAVATVHALRILNFNYDIPIDTSLCILTIFTLLLFIRSQSSQINQKKLNMPTVTVSTQLPFFGTAIAFLSHTPWDLMESWHRQYGPIYNFTLLGRSMVSIEHPTYIKDILQSKIQNVQKDVHFAYKPFMTILGKGIVTSEGQSWMKQRRKISNLLKMDILNVIPSATLGAVQRLMIKLDACCSCCSEEKKTIDIAEELRHLTLQVISETFMSLDPKESDEQFATMYLPIVEEANKRVWSPERSYMFFLPSFWKYIVGVRRLNRYVSTLILKRWELRMEERNDERHCIASTTTTSASRNHDILDKVLDHYEKENPGKYPSYNDVCQLRDEFKTFMLAGHETSAAMMTWTFYELMKDDVLMEKVKEEAETVFGGGGSSSSRITSGKDTTGVKDWLHADSKSLPTREELAQLCLSEGCLRESLRKYSVVPTVIRQITKPTKVGNHILNRGTCIVINIQSTHHNEQYWPNPNVYDPNRFTNPNIHPESYTFLPFIDGPRNCLGQYLALLESKMVVSLISMRYKLKMKKEVNEDEDPRHRFMVPLIPKESVDVYVTKR